MLDPAEFLSDHGIRALSKRHEQAPLQLEVDGYSSTLGYAPGESLTGCFGGNSNWRGPVWMPINYLLIEVLRTYHRYLGDAFEVECPTGSGRFMSLDRVSDELAARVVGLFLRQDDGRGRCSAMAPSCRTTRRGAIRCSSTSTSTATRAPVSAPRTRPAGRGSSRS